MKAFMHLERWAIDELTDSTATLLRCAYNQRFELPDSRDGRSVIEEGETAIASVVWGEEYDRVLDRQPLERFIRRWVRRSRRPGLPPARPLREGDVYWVISRQAMSSQQDSAEKESTRQFLATCEQHVVEIWDVTGAARQAVKDAHFRVMAKQAAKAVPSAPEREPRPVAASMDMLEAQPGEVPLTMRQAMEQVVNDDAASGRRS